MFDRTANLTNNQIINYRCDPSEKWLVLIGIASGAPEVSSFHESYFSFQTPFFTCKHFSHALPTYHIH